jgi:hypothetical protein
MKIVLALCSAALALTGLMTAAASAPAAAASRPVIYNLDNGWHDAHIRPRMIFVRPDGAPFLERLQWSHWSQNTAAASGYLLRRSPTCRKPPIECKLYAHPVRVYLHRVRSHDGISYFSLMRWRWRGRPYHWRVRHGYFVPA